MLSITLTAVHQQSTIPTVTIYVSAGGSDSNGDGTTSATAYASIDRAAQDMTDAAMAYIVYIDGQLSDAQQLPSSITAAAVTLTGANGLNAAGEPQDAIDRALTSASDSGTALSIEADVPVTITNLKTAGGFTNGAKGGGIDIAEDAVVQLADGALVMGNRNSGSGNGKGGGGIRLYDGTLQIASGTIACNGTGKYGGGIYVPASISPVLAGGTIRDNQASNKGGALYYVHDVSAVTCYLKVSGSIYIPLDAEQKNTVYLGNNYYSQIKLMTALTAQTPVMTITPALYPASTGTRAVLVDDNSGALVGTEHGKFAIIPNGSDQYEITNDGKLTKL